VLSTACALEAIVHWEVTVYYHRMTILTMLRASRRRQPSPQAAGLSHRRPP